MTDQPISPELRMPKHGHGVYVGKIQKAVNNFTTKCSYCFFMGMEFKVDVNISQCHLSPPENVQKQKKMHTSIGLLRRSSANNSKDDRQTIVVMPQGLKTMPTHDMWPQIHKGNFWLIDDQHNVEASKKIQLMNEWDDPNHQKEQLKFWKALVV